MKRIQTQLVYVVGLCMLSLNFACQKVTPEVAFSIEGERIHAGKEVQFRNHSQDALTYEWDFGDGKKSNEFEPSHIYSEKGSYTVVLSASHDKTATAEWTFEVLKALPEISFDYEGEELFAKAEIQFLNTSRGAENFRWEFGDGNTSTEKNPKHTYASSGEYKVRLTALGQDEASYEETLLVLTPLPKAVFQVNQLQALAPATLVFTNQSEDAERYEWDFGDGRITAGESPSHTYEVPGTYSVSLKAFSEDKVDEVSVKVEIKANIFPGNGVANLKLTDTWGGLKSKISENSYNHFIIQLSDGSYLHLTRFSQTGVTFLFHNRSFSLSNSEPVVNMGIFEPFYGTTDRGTTFGHNRLDIMQDYSDMPEHRYNPETNSLEYPMLGVNFSMDDDTDLIDFVVIYPDDGTIRRTGHNYKELDYLKYYKMASEGPLKNL